MTGGAWTRKWGGGSSLMDGDVDERNSFDDDKEEREREREFFL